MITSKLKTENGKQKTEKPKVASETKQSEGDSACDAMINHRGNIALARECHHVRTFFFRRRCEARSKQDFCDEKS